MMKQNLLGTSEIYVSEIGLGCMSLPTDLRQAKLIVDEAIAQGINYFDTADLYDKGQNEEIVGKALKQKRQQIVLASKVGNEWSMQSDEVKWNPSKSYIKTQIHTSLKRLQTDYIDLYQLHGGTIDDNVDETIEAFEELKQEGLIRAYGISSIRPNVIKRFLEKSDVESIMMQYSLFDRRPEEWFDAIAEKKGSVVTRGSLAKGLLTSEALQRARKMDGYLTYSASELENTIQKLLEVHPHLHALALQSALQQNVVQSLVVGASTAKQLKETLTAYDVPVSNEQLTKAKALTRLDVYENHRSELDN